MSLLLEALKKAEKAKEDAQRRARGESAEKPAALQLEGEAAAGARPVLTRDNLPDVRQPLEMVGDELEVQSAESAAAAERPRPAPAPVPAAPRERQAPPARGADAQAGERAAGRKVFEAKFKEPNPRLPFFIAMGVLGTFAVGTVIYFWIQLRPPAPLVNTNPKSPAGEVQVVAAAKPAPGAAPAASAKESAIPGLPASAPAAPAFKAPAAKPAPQAERTPEAPLLKPAPRTATRTPGAAPAAAPPGTEVSTSRPIPQVHPKVSTGYAAYNAGDLAGARTEYQQALNEEPANRDALLGLAALDVRTGRYEAAEAVYLRLLQADPRDSHAQAALVALRGGRGDPVAAESRIKSMLADNPGAHMLNFALGNQLAQQGRWAEAQQQYFKAFAAEPDNPDFAYNLAVSLDHLRQPALALGYYRRAVALAKTRGASFDPAAAEARAAQLAR